MSKKATSFFQAKTFAKSLCFLSLSTAFLTLDAKVNVKLDESVTYTMNFRNINIVEYIRFVSKISKTNFIFNEQELNFPVTLVSDQPVSAKNLFSALAQVLEVNGFTLSDQEGSILVTKNAGSSQLAAINQLSAPLITRIYKIDNLNLATMTQIVKSIVSKSALVESVSETSQLIVTDTGPNLEKLGTFIHDLDSSGSNLKILTYKVLQQSPQVLSESLKNVMAPFQGNNAFLTVPQPSNNQLIIVSTPYLLLQTQEALKALDIPDAPLPIETSSGGIFMYIPKIRKAQDLKSSLLIIAETLKSEGPSTQALVSMIENLKQPDGSNCLLFVGQLTAWTKVQEIIQGIDNQENVQSLFIYNIKSVDHAVLETLLQEAATKIEESGDPDNLAEAIDSMQYVPTTNSLVFAGSINAIEKLKTMIPEFDVVRDSTAKDYTYFIFELKNHSGEIIINELKQLEPTLNIADSKNMIEAIKRIKWMKNNNSLLLSGPQKTVKELEDLITKLDGSNSENAILTQKSFVIYPLKGSNGDIIANQLHAMAQEVSTSSAQSIAHQEALKRVKYIPDTNSMMIFGNQESIAFVENLISKLDSSTPVAGSKSFVLYRVKGKNGQEIVSKLHNFSKHLPQNTPHDKNIEACLKNTTYMPDTSSILIRGDQESMAFVESLAEKLDEGMSLSTNTSFVVVSLKEASGQSLIAQLHEMGLHIADPSPASQAIKACLESVKFLPDTNSLMITGTKEAIAFTQSVVEKLDTATLSAGQATFYLYKLQSQTGSSVIAKVKSLEGKLPSISMADKNVISAIENLQWIPENNAILISGNQQTIDRVSALIAQYDAVPGNEGENRGDFLIYSPHNVSLEILEQSLQEYAVALKQSGLADPNLIETINTAKSVPSANHLVLTGNTESITKVKSILAMVDQVTPESTIQQIGKMTFFVHQLHSLTPEQFSSMMKSFEANLSKTGSYDPQVAKAISTMQYLKETNSFLFTGPASALEKVSQIADKIDIGKSVSEGSMTYEIYNPQYVTGLNLIEQMCQFAQGLSDSGVKDQNLYDTIDNIKWIEKSNAMIITGTIETIAKVQDLLKRFDVAGGGKTGNLNTSNGFMVFKLQYHSGTEIQTALNKLAPTFAQGGANPNPGLAAAINSIQWIPVTNSLVVSGDADNLQKLKTLISEIDVPLKQVFIEILVVETDSTNSQNFGLQWFGKGQLKNQLGFGTGNFGSGNPLTSTTNVPNFSGVGSGISLTQFPNGQSIPFFGNQSGGGNAPSGAGFDLGVIGDVLFHKGQSFLSLGSLVNAIQADADATIVMNPKILTQDSHNSTIFIGQNIPFIGSNVTNSAANTTQSANIEYRDVGTNLSITPKLGDDNVVTLEITYNMSAQVPNTNGGQGGFNGIQTSQTNMTTRVHVPDQHFVVLSGMLQDTRQHYKTGLPCLGGLPIIGLAFSDNERFNNKNNILIFIRPCIINHLEDLKELTEKQENKYRDMFEKQIDREDFDAAINLVKDPADE